MKRTILSLIIAAVVLAAACMAPAAAMVTPEGTTAASTAGSAPYVSATVSAASVPAGTPVTVSGVSTGPGSSVQVWAFAGNYLNVSTVAVNADGTYAKTFDTTGLPAATYYVFVQNPGSDSTLDVAVSGYSGTVVDAGTGAVIFNFTGTGSVQDSAAAAALAKALNAQGSDDIYSKTQFVISASATATGTTEVLVGGDKDEHGCIGSAGYTWCEEKQKCLREWEESCTGTAAAAGTATSLPTTAKSPLPAGIAIAAALSVLGIAIARKDR